MPARSLYVAFVRGSRPCWTNCFIAHSTNAGLVLRSLDGVSIVTFALPFTAGSGFVVRMNLALDPHYPLPCLSRYMIICR